MLNKTPLFHPSLGLRVFLFLSLFLSFSLSQREKLLSSLSCPGLQDPRERAPCAYVKQCNPRVKGFIGFLCKPRNISLFLFLFYFLIIDSGPPGSGPLKDLNTIVCIYYIFFIHSSFSGHLGCFYVPAVLNIFTIQILLNFFHILVIIHNALMNTGV